MFTKSACAYPFFKANLSFFLTHLWQNTSRFGRERPEDETFNPARYHENFESRHGRGPEDEPRCDAPDETPNRERGGGDAWHFQKHGMALVPKGTPPPARPAWAQVLKVVGVGH